jgi:hypothetical protein
VVGGPTDGRDIVISDHYEAKKRQLKGHWWRFGETHESFSTASISRPSAGATVGLLSAISRSQRYLSTLEQPRHSSLGRQEIRHRDPVQHRAVTLQRLVHAAVL